MLLQDGIQIYAPSAKVFIFFQEMAENYVPWHPDHHEFCWIDGEAVEVGHIFAFKETINGHQQDKAMRFIEVERNRLLAFEPVNWFVRLLMPRLSFEIKPIDEQSCRFIAKIHLRVGPLAQRLNAKEFNAVRQHMKEEGQNLKQMVEAR